VGLRVVGFEGWAAGLKCVWLRGRGLSVGWGNDKRYPPPTHLLVPSEESYFFPPRFLGAGWRYFDDSSET
jgi:hypothetical protein